MIYSEKSVYAHIGEYCVAHDGRAVVEMGKTGVLFVVTVWLEHSPSWALYLLGLVLRSLLYTRVFVIFHDLAHNSFFSSPAVNRSFGLFCNMWLGFPLEIWRDKHNFHHKTSNDLNHVQDNQTAPLSLRQYLDLPAPLRLVYRTLYSSFGLKFITPTVYGIMMFFEALYIDRLAWVLILLGGYLKSHFSFLPYDILA